MFPYPFDFEFEVRQLLSDELKDRDDDFIEEVLAETLGDVSLEEIENVVGTLSQIGSGILQALPAVIPVVGTAIGGPIGGVVGGLAGGAVAAATRPGAASQKPAPKRAGPSKPPQRPAPQKPSPRPPAPARPAPASSSAAQLLSLLFRPEMLSALIAMILGINGSDHVLVGDTEVPIGAFANLLSVLSQQAGYESGARAPEGSESVPRYLLGEGGQLKCDIAVPEYRAQVLWELLQAEAPGEDWELEPGWEWLFEAADPEHYYEVFDNTEFGWV